MSESKHRHHPTPELPSAVPYWKRAHHDWRFWVALVLMFLAITVYIVSDNLAFLPHD
jgi:hypothetical protein